MSQDVRVTRDEGKGAVSVDEAHRILARELASRDLDFVARLNTVWTLMGLEAWLARQAQPMRGVVFVVASSLTHPSVVPEGTRQELARHPGVRLVEVAPYGSAAALRRLRRRRVADLGRLSSLIGTTGRALRLVVPRRPDLGLLADVLGTEAGRLRRPVFDVLDEGFGGARVPGWHSVGMRAAELSDRVTRQIFETHDHALCVRGADGLRTLPNDAVVTSLRGVIQRHNGHQSVERSGARPVALLLTSYWAEYGFMSEPDERALCARVTRILLDKGYSVRLKQHPREQLGRYDDVLAPFTSRDVRSMRRDFSAEALFPDMDPARDVVVGLISNAHFVGQLLFGLPAVVLRGRDWGSTSRTARQDEEGYIPLFPRGILGLDDLALVG